MNFNEIYSRIDSLICTEIERLRRYLKKKKKKGIKRNTIITFHTVQRIQMGIVRY